MKKFLSTIVLCLLLIISCARVPAVKAPAVENSEQIYQCWYHIYCSSYSLGTQANDASVCSELQVAIFETFNQHPDPQYRAMAVFMSVFCGASCKAGNEHQPLLDYYTFREKASKFFKDNE